MEAERVASEVPAEPDRVAPPAPVLLQTAPAEYVRSLSRAYGNRRVVALLQRQPAAAAPAIARGYKAVSLQDPRWQKVDDLLTWTQLGWEAARSCARTPSRSPRPWRGAARPRSTTPMATSAT